MDGKGIETCQRILVTLLLLVQCSTDGRSDVNNPDKFGGMLFLVLLCSKT